MLNYLKQIQANHILFELKRIFFSTCADFKLHCFTELLTFYIEQFN